MKYSQSAILFLIRDPVEPLSIVKVKNYFKKVQLSTANYALIAMILLFCIKFWILFIDFSNYSSDINNYSNNVAIIDLLIGLCAGLFASKRYLVLLTIFTAITFPIELIAIIPTVQSGNSLMKLVLPLVVIYCLIITLMPRYFGGVIGFVANKIVMNRKTVASIS